MPLPLHVIIDPNPHISRINRDDIVQGLADASEMLEHDLDEEMTEFLERGVAACRTWLDEPHEISRQTRLTVAAFLKRTESKMMVICHPEHYQIGKVVRAARTMTDVLELEDRVKIEAFSGFDDYGDVFETLAEILRCPTCFYGSSYNSINPKTEKQYSWEEISQALLFTPEDLKLPRHFRAELYRDEENPMDKKTASFLTGDIWSSCFRLGFDSQAVAWQIIKYSIYQETPAGPKLSLRTGQWGQLAAHVHKAFSWLIPLNQVDLTQHEDIDNASKIMNDVVLCVKTKWFNHIMSDTRYALNNAALELSRRLAEGGDPRADQSQRSEPLFDLDLLVRLGGDQDPDSVPIPDPDPDPAPGRARVPFDLVPPVGHRSIYYESDDDESDNDHDLFFGAEEENTFSGGPLLPASQAVMDQLRAIGYEFSSRGGQLPPPTSPT